jgi:osmotically-inducible protein OsmY
MPVDVRTLLERLWVALEGDPRVDAKTHRITLAFEDGELALEGELADAAAKTRALQIASALPEVHRIVDRLTTTPAVPMPDAEMRDHLRDAFLGEPILSECRIVLVAEGAEDRARDPESPRGSIHARIASGVITLEGEVPSLAHARLTGVLAWWIPGTRAVNNHLRPVPPEEDNDDEISDAVRIALEKEPFVDADQLGIRTAGGRVTLYGTLPSAEQKQIAERDAWFVSGVLDVDNRIYVQTH